MRNYVLGIDIAKDTFDVVLLGGPQRYGGHFSNDTVGFGKLLHWLEHRQADQVHACMEATNQYWIAIAELLRATGHTVSVVNPKRIKKHAEARMERNKTDSQDAWVIADYCLKHQPGPWTPPPAAYQELREMVRFLVALKQDRQRERNRRALDPSEVVQQHIDAHLTFLNQQITQLEEEITAYIAARPALQHAKDLLISIPGVGCVVAWTFMSEIPDVSRFAQASQVAAFVGLTPGRQESGTSRHSSGRLVKWGNADLRRALYMPALSAHRYNPILAALKERLDARGKSKMTVIVAIMRKMVHLCYGVLKTQKPFDPQHALNTSAA